MQGRIDKVWQNRSKNEKPYLTLEIGGERYNLWDEELFDQVQEGAVVDYDARQSGKYNNITALGPADSNGGPETPRDMPDPNYRSRSIRRMSCLRAASTLAASLDLSEAGDPIEYTVGIARKFEGYIEERPEPEPEPDEPG